MANKNFLPKGSIQIVDGPGKFDLMLSNFDFKTVEITCAENGRLFKLRAHINFALPEDGSKERWIGMIGLSDSSGASERRSYYYDSKNRRGIINEIDKKWELITAN